MHRPLIALIEQIQADFERMLPCHPEPRLRAIMDGSLPALTFHPAGIYGLAKHNKYATVILNGIFLRVKAYAVKDPTANGRLEAYSVNTVATRLFQLFKKLKKAPF